MCRVLILDDEIRFAESLKLIVEGFEDGATLTDIATTPEEAFEAARKAIQSGYPYTVFIIDQRLGAGRDGIEVMKELKTISPDSSAVVLTGVDDREVGSRAYAAGASRYLVKSPDEKEIYFVLNSIVQARRVDIENQWRRVFSEMMENALRSSSFHDVARVVVDHCLQLGFTRAHLFWAPRQENGDQSNTLVGIERAGSGRFSAFPKERFDLSGKRILGSFLNLPDSVFIHEAEVGDRIDVEEFKRESESIGCSYPLGGLWILPLRSGNDLLGGLFLDFGDTRKHLAIHHRTLLDFLARQVSVTLEHSRLYNEQRRTSVEMRGLQHASVEMLRIVELNVESFWMAVLTVATSGNGLGFNRAFLFLTKGDSNLFKGETAIDNKEEPAQGGQWNEELYDLNSLIKDAFTKGVHLTALNAFIKTVEISLDEFGERVRSSLKQLQAIELLEEEAAEQLPASIFNAFQPTACAILPVYVRNTLLGVVLVDNQHSSKPLSKIPLHNLQTLLANAGLVWDNHRQRTQSEELLDVTHEILGGAGYKPLQETLNLICKAARAFCQADWGLIYPLQKITVPPFYEFEFESFGHDGSLTTGYDIVKEQPNLGGISLYIMEKGDLFVEDVDDEKTIIGDIPLTEHLFIRHEKIKALIGIAIRDPYTREPLGILYLDYLRRCQFKQEVRHEIRHANACARLAAAAISNNRHPTDRHQRGLLNAAQSISKTVGTALNIEEVIVGILTDLKSLFRDTSLCVLLYDDDENALRFAPRTLKYYKILNPDFENTRSFPMYADKQGSIACKVARKTLETRRTELLHVKSVSEDPDYLPLNPKTVSELCVSLVDRNGHLLGVLALEREKHAFESDDVDFVRMVAEQLGQAIERSQQSDNLAFKSTVATMTAWASDIAHDINSEVGQIRGNAYLLKNTISDSLALQCVDEIDESAKKLSSVGPWSEQAREEIPLDATIQRIVRDLATQKNMESEFDLHTPDIYIKANPNEVRQVFRHLIRNSSRAMEDSVVKRISVETHSLLDGRVEVRFADYGPGIPDEIRDAIFQRSASTKTSSGGYGLLLVRQLVEDIGGRITLLPPVDGKGAVFSIKLPICDVAPDIE